MQYSNQARIRASYELDLGYQYQASTQLRLQSFEIGLKDEY